MGGGHCSILLKHSWEYILRQILIILVSTGLKVFCTTRASSCFYNDIATVQDIEPMGFCLDFHF